MRESADASKISRIFSSRLRFGITFIIFFILAALCLSVFSQEPTIAPVLNAPSQSIYGFDQYVRAALAAWRDREKWRGLMRSGMEKDFSWGKPAGEYAELYRRLSVNLGDP